MSEAEVSFAVGMVKEFGPLIALIFYYIWRDFVTSKQNVLREVRLVDRVTQLEDFQRGELTSALREVTKTMSEFVAQVDKHPCLLTREVNMDVDQPIKRRAGA